MSDARQSYHELPIWRLPRRSRARQYALISITFIIGWFLLRTISPAKSISDAHVHRGGTLSSPRDTTTSPTQRVFARDQMVLVIKTGTGTLYEKVPVLLETVVKRWRPTIVIHSDKAEKVGEYEVQDILKDVKAVDEFQKLRAAVHSKWQSVEVNGKTIPNPGWMLDKYKNIPSLLSVWQAYPNRDWYVFIDDDTFVFMGNLMRYLSILDEKHPIYMGKPTEIGGEVFAHGGSGYVLSIGAMRKIEQYLGAGDVREEVLRRFEKFAEGGCCGDHTLGKLINATGIRLAGLDGNFNDNPLHEQGFDSETLCKEIFTLHHVDGRGIQTLWDWEAPMEDRLEKGEFSGIPSRKRPETGNGNYILNLDVFQSLVLPLLERDAIVSKIKKDIPDKDGWDNFPAKSYPLPDIESYNGPVKIPGSRLVSSVSSANACKFACMDRKDCLQWRYQPGKCTLGKKMYLGRPITKEEGWYEKRGMVSGWITERIRMMVDASKCIE